MNVSGAALQSAIGLIRIADGRGNSYDLDSAAAAANFAQARERAGAGVRIYQCIKGDGYGFGIERAVRLGLEAGADGFCVGTPAEAWRARSVAGSRPILLFAGALPEALPRLAEAGVIVTISSVEACAALLATGVSGSFFLKLDCGFRRYGLDEEALRTVLTLCGAQTALRCTGVYTHFGSRWREVVPDGLPRFDAMADLVRTALGTPIETMVASSTLLAEGEPLPYSAIDPGRFLYGMLPGGDDAAMLRPVVRAIRSTLLQSTRLKTAQIPSIGYAERLPLAAGQRIGVFPLGWVDGLSARGGFGHVLVGGLRTPVIARTLQHSIVALLDQCDAAVGDEVILVGRQVDAEISLEAAATAQGVSIPEFHMRVLAGITREASAGEP